MEKIGKEYSNLNSAGNYQEQQNETTKSEGALRTVLPVEKDHSHQKTLEKRIAILRALAEKSG